MELIKYKSGYKYQLVEDYLVVAPFLLGPVTHTFFDVNQDNVLRIKAGYAWDGPSGPTVDTLNFMRGSLVHDVGYQMMAEGLVPRQSRKAWDEWLRDICREDGMTRARAWWVYQAVRRFGGRYGRTPRPVCEAP